MPPSRLSVCLFLLAVSQFACGGSHFVVKSNDRPQELTKPVAHIHSDRLQKLLDSPSISPYAIENYIKESAESDEEFVDFKPIWERLNNLKTDDDVILEEDREIFDGFKPSFTRWQVELIDIPDLSNQINRVVVKIMIYGGAYRRFLIFKKETAPIPQSDWQFTGHFDTFSPREVPDLQKFLQVYSTENESWLIIRDLTGTGTGFLAEDEMWYRIDTEQPHLVLSYPIKGHQVNGVICALEYKSRAKTLTDQDGTLIREISYKASLGAAYKPDFHWLFTKTCKASFRWDKNEGKFVFDTRNSTISEEELNKEFGEGDKGDCIKYNFDQLIRFATTANSEQRAWLEDVLETLKDETQKMKLRNALGH